MNQELKKPTLSDATRTPIAAFKPAYLDQRGGDDKLMLVAVTPTGQQRSVQCTPQVFAAAYGQPLPDNKHSALDRLTEHDFVLLTKNIKGKEMCVGVHVFPRNDFLGTSIPIKAAEVDVVEVVINPASGELNVRKAPISVKAPAMHRILAAIDKRDTLKVGEVIDSGLGLRVKNIIGNEVQFTVNISTVRQERTTLGNVMAAANAPAAVPA